MSAEETYLRNHTLYGAIAYDDGDERDHEYDPFEKAETLYGI